MIPSLRDCILETARFKKTLAHFNFSSLEMLRGIVNAALTAKVPVVVGVSEGERAFVGVRQAVALIRSLREECEEYDHPIYLNADHTYSVEAVKEAVDAGFDAVIFDGAKLPIDENIRKTAECVHYARERNPAVLVEGELGYIGQSSKILDAIPEGAGVAGDALVRVDDARRFVTETKVDLFAPAVGNIHGMLREGRDPHLDIERIRAISEATGIPLVLHGGSGTPEEDIIPAIKAGIALIHISTELRVAYRKGLEDGLKADPNEVAPYRFLSQSVKSVQTIVESKLSLFNTL